MERKISVPFIISCLLSQAINPTVKMNVVALNFWCLVVAASLCSDVAWAQRRRRRVSAELHEVLSEDTTFWRALSSEGSMSLSMSMSMSLAPQAPQTTFPTKSPSVPPTKSPVVETVPTPAPSVSTFPTASVTDDPTVSEEPSVSAFPSADPTDEPTFTFEPSGTSEPCKLEDSTPQLLCQIPSTHSPSLPSHCSLDFE